MARPVVYGGQMRFGLLYLIAVVLIAVGIIVDIAGGDETAWGMVRGALIGAGGGLLAATFMMQRREKKAQARDTEAD